MERNTTTCCRYCGETIDVKAKACPHCGSDERTGWSEYRYMDTIDTIDEGDYEEIYQNEFSGGDRKVSKKQFIIGSILLIILIFILIRAFL